MKLELNNEELSILLYDLNPIKNPELYTKLRKMLGFPNDDDDLSDYRNVAKLIMMEIQLDSLVTEFEEYPENWVSIITSKVKKFIETNNLVLDLFTIRHIASGTNFAEKEYGELPYYKELSTLLEDYWEFLN